MVFEERAAFSGRMIAVKDTQTLRCRLTDFIDLYYIHHMYDERHVKRPRSKKELSPSSSGCKEET